MKRSLQAGHAGPLELPIRWALERAISACDESTPLPDSVERELHGPSDHR
jgi:hypothetical protein